IVEFTADWSCGTLATAGSETTFTRVGLSGVPFGMCLSKSGRTGPLAGQLRVAKKLLESRASLLTTTSPNTVFALASPMTSLAVTGPLSVDSDWLPLPAGDVDVIVPSKCDVAESCGSVASP